MTQFNRNQGYGRPAPNSYGPKVYQTVGGPKVPEKYVDEAQKVIEALRAERDGQDLTTTQLRNLLSMTADIYNQAERLQNDTLTPDLIQKIEYLRIRFVYESGRTKAVKCLTQMANLLEKLKSIGNSRDEFIRFNHYMEALVAFHRYFGGKDK